MVYKFKPGSRLKSDPQTAGEICAELAANDNLTAKALVDMSRPPDAPLHGDFEWNDTVAAERYREDQARYIIRCIIKVEEEQTPVRAFFNIDRSEPEYKRIDVILKSEDDTAKLLKTAMLELQAIRKKYCHLKQLAPVFNAIDQMTFDAAAS